MEENIITSVQNARVKHVVALQQKSSLRREEGLFVVEGQREIEHCIACGYEVVEMFTVDSLRFTDDYPTTTVSPQVYEKMAYRGSTEGIIAVAKCKMHRLSNLLPLTIPEQSSPTRSLSHLLNHATADSFGTEFMDFKLAIKTVASLQEALDHIDENGSGHSEAIVTMNETAARQFQAHVDAACVYWNAPTSFTDGAQFGLGAEIGISTQKLGPRGPMALEEICTYKWLIEGEGQTRP